jgi:hypothetical protein
MYPAQALSRILAVQPVLDAVERDQAAPRAAFEHLSIGQTLTGQVKSLAKGITLVDIAGQTVALRLPHPAAPGDTLRLRFAGHMPQPVFLLEAPEADAGDGPRLSETARMLSGLMQRLPAHGAPPTLTPPGPLLDRPGAQPADLALALRAALVRSGLFYESHLADWAAGRDSLEGLMQEPQNRLAGAEAARAAASPAGALALPARGETAAEKPLNPLHALLSQQLQVLESPEFVWRGEVWPGQALTWHLRRETESPHEHSAAPAADATDAGWESRLTLTLPQLGTLGVHIRLDARQAFSIRLVPEQPGTESLLKQDQGRLAERLAAAGCTLQTLTVRHDAGA